MSLDLFRTLLNEAGYQVSYRTGEWVDCYVTSATERWHGHGFGEDDALSDVLQQMMPSALGKHLLVLNPKDTKAANAAAEIATMAASALPAPGAESYPSAAAMFVNGAASGSDSVVSEHVPEPLVAQASADQPQAAPSPVAPSEEPAPKKAEPEAPKKEAVAKKESANGRGSKTSKARSAAAQERAEAKAAAEAAKAAAEAAHAASSATAEEATESEGDEAAAPEAAAAVSRNRTASASRVVAAGGTHKGTACAKNEDAFTVVPTHGLFVVADGLDTHSAGDVAATLAVETIAKAFDSKTGASSVRRQALPLLVAAIQRANAKVFGAGKHETKLRGMATTIAAALTQGSRVAIAHIGDSRIYRLRNTVLELLTTDHSVANSQARPVEVAASVDVPAFRRSQLTRALGTRANVETDGSVFPARPGDVMLLCTDGLHVVVGTDDMTEILHHNTDPNVAVAQLLARASEKGSPDNVTAIVMRWD